MTRSARGQGSIYQRNDGKWVAAISVGWRDGAPKRLKRVCPTEGEAVAALKLLQREADDGNTMPASRRTVEWWLREWLTTVAVNRLRPRTYAGYQTTIEKHLIPALGRHQLRKLEPEHVQRYMNEKSKTLSAKSVQHHHALLRRALRVAESRGHVSRNVARLVDVPTVRNAEIVPPSPEQVASLLAGVKGHRFEPLFRVALGTGMRQSEILGLKWADVDMDGGTLRVERSLQRYGGAFHLDDVKTQKSRRTIALSAPVVAALREQRTRQIEERLLAGPLWKGGEWGLVFAGDDGSPLHGRKVTEAFQRALRDAGLGHYRFHDARHFAATFLLSAGINLKVVQDILGHSTIHTTANIYSHVTPEIQREAADRLGSALAT